MTLRDIPLITIDGTATTFGAYADSTVLVVNVASTCGFTKQYAQLEELQQEYADRGFTVLGFPCNQFGGQEAGTAEEIAEFCSTTWDVTFPMFDKVEVTGPNAHPLFAHVTATADATGEAGPVAWNFEKFLVTPTGGVTRFRSATQPDAPEILAAIETALERSTAAFTIGAVAG